MGAGEREGGEHGDRVEFLGAEVIEIDGTLAIPQLAHVKVVVAHLRPAEQDIRRSLDGVLALDDALTMMSVLACREIGREC